MASATQKYLCPCSVCNSRKSLTKRTIQGHVKRNQAELRDLIAQGGSQHTIGYLQSCFDQTTQLLASLPGGSQGSSLSPYPDGVCFLFMLLIITNLI